MKNPKKQPKNDEEEIEEDDCELLKLDDKGYLEKLNYIKQTNYKSFYKSGKSAEQLEKDIDNYFNRCSFC